MGTRYSSRSLEKPVCLRQTLFGRDLTKWGKGATEPSPLSQTWSAGHPQRALVEELTSWPQSQAERGSGALVGFGGGADCEPAARIV